MKLTHPALMLALLGTPVLANESLVESPNNQHESSLKLADATFIEEHFEEKVPDVDFDTDCVTLPVKLRPEPGRFQPMIQEGETGYVPSVPFLEMAPTLAIMNQLAYARGQNYRFGHEMTYTDSLAGWTLSTIGATRGYVAGDPNAGFVAYNRSLGAIAIIKHGSINTADWITNGLSFLVRIDENPAPDGTLLPLVGRAHFGFLMKYLSCQGQIMDTVDALMTTMTAEEIANLKFFVSGHSQGAILAQLLTAHLCQHLRKHFGADFNNAKANRVHGWLLASPVGLDKTAAAFAKAVIGERNICVQNTWLDIVPNANLAVNDAGIHYEPYESLGTPAMQSSTDAMKRAAKAHSQAVDTHFRNGDFFEAVGGAIPRPSMWRKHAISALHMATDNVNYRGVGSSFAFDPDMVDKDLDGLNASLQRAFDHKQAQLRVKAATEAKGKLSLWGRFKACFQ
jgi:hypothetical protein